MPGVIVDGIDPSFLFFDNAMSLQPKRIGRSLFPALLSCLLLLMCAGGAWGASPLLAHIMPRGVQRGTEADLVLSGSRLEDAKELFLYSPGITVTSLEVKSGNELHAHIKVDAAAQIGEYAVRVRTETGISELRTFYVTPFPVIPFKAEGTPMGKRGLVFYDFNNPQPIDQNVTVTGSIGNEQVQYFSVEAKKGQRLTAEVHGMRLGELFDPYVAILDSKRFELSVSDDTALAMQDPIASTIIPADGKYIILLRESSYGQGSHYLLHVGTFPRPTIVYPMGGRPGENLHVRFIGDVAGAIEKDIKLPDEVLEKFDVFAEQDGLVSPSPNHLCISNMPNVLEQEPNDDIKSATVYDGELPVAMNGIIDHPGDVDFFRFKAKRGQTLELRVIARHLRSPLDSILTLYNARGGQMAFNDDAGGPDSYIRFDVPQDGQYAIAVSDQLHQGGPDYAYRVEIAEIHRDLVFTIPQVAQNSQERWTIPVPRGNRYATLMRATRVNTGGDVTQLSADLPPGVTMSSADGSQQEMPVVFEAKADAPVAGKLCQLTSDLYNGETRVEIKPHYEQKVDLVYGNNNSSLYSTKVDSLAVAVTKEAPFKLHLEQPKVPLVQGGSIELKVTAERAADFKSPIQVRLLFTPPGVGGLSAMDMPGDQSQLAYPLNAQPNAQLKTWKICVVGMSDVNGELWVSSELVDLTVGEPYLLANIQMGAGEQGKTTNVLCKLDQRQKFEGKAKAKLMGLPANVTAEDVDITCTDDKIIFPVTVGEKAPLGPRASMFCRVTILKDGQEIVHNLGNGAVFRVDRPPEVKAASAASAAAAPSAKPAAKPAGDAPRVLSRLEKLREEQAQK